MSGQQIFYVTYNSSFSMGFSKSIQLKDSCYLNVGGITFVNSSILLIKTGYNGDTIWTKVYASTFTGYSEQGVDVVEDTTNGNIFLLSYNRIGPIFPQIELQVSSILCLDSVGNIIWTKYYGDTLHPQQPFALQLRYNTLFISGNRSTAGPTDSLSVFLMAIDKNTGNVNWSYDYGDSAFISLNSSVITATGEHLIIGTRYTDFNDLNTLDAYVIKLDSIGTIIWSKIFYSNVADWGFAISEKNNGNYICLIKSKMNNANNKTNINLVELDTAGQILWCNEYSFANQNLQGYAVKQMENKNIFIGMNYAGTTTTNGVNYILTDSSGTFLESGLKGGYTPLYKVENTFDNGLLICTGPGVIKTDSLLNGYCYQKINNVVQQTISNFNVSTAYFHQLPFSTTSNSVDSIGPNFQINVNPLCQTATGVIEKSKNDNYQIFPNPATDFIEIKIPNALNYFNKFYRIAIVNVSGQTVFFENVKLTSTGLKIDVAHFTSGLYCINIPELNAFNLKFIKSN